MMFKLIVFVLLVAFWCQDEFLSSDFRFWEFGIFVRFAFVWHVCNFGRGVGFFDVHGWIRLEISLRLLATRPQTDGSRPHSRKVCVFL